MYPQTSFPSAFTAGMPIIWVSTTSGFRAARSSQISSYRSRASIYWDRTQPAKPASGPWMFRRESLPPGLTMPCRAPGVARVEGARSAEGDSIAGDEAGLAFEDEEGVDLVVVVVRGDTRPFRLDLQQEHGDLWEPAEDRDCAVLALEALTPAGERHDHVGAGRPPSRGRRLLVELALRPEVLHEPAARRVEVEEPQLSPGPPLSKPCTTSRRHEHERPRRHGRPARARAQPEAPAPPASTKKASTWWWWTCGSAPRCPAGVPRPGHVQPVVVAEDAQLALGRSVIASPSRSACDSMIGCTQAAS